MLPFLVAGGRRASDGQSAGGGADTAIAFIKPGRGACAASGDEDEGQT